VTEPRDGAPEEPLEPIDGELDDDDGGERPDDADVDTIEAEILDEAETEAIEADEADTDDYDAAVREIGGEAPVTTAAERRSSATKRRSGATTATSRVPTPSEIAVHVKDDVSKWFVLGTVAVFVLILLNGMFLGSGGLLRPLSTPTPSASPSASPSGSATPSGTASPSGSASPSASPSVAPSATPAASASPSAS
jgi:hypothetical protein